MIKENCKRLINSCLLWLVVFILAQGCAGGENWSKVDEIPTIGNVLDDVYPSLVSGESNQLEEACTVNTDELGEFLQHGYCFSHTPTCVSDLDCPHPYTGCDLARQRCIAWNSCGCSSDSDCDNGSHCITNEQVCGQCMPEKNRCTNDIDCPNDGETCWRGECVDACVTKCEQAKSVIQFNQEKGCFNDGSAEFCVPKDNTLLVQLIQAIAPQVTCRPGRGRAQCDRSSELLCFYPTGRTECVKRNGALRTHAWHELCEIAALPVVRSIVQTFYE